MRYPSTRDLRVVLVVFFFVVVVVVVVVFSQLLRSAYYFKAFGLNFFCVLLFFPALC